MRTMFVLSVAALFGLQAGPLRARDYGGPPLEAEEVARAERAYVDDRDKKVAQALAPHFLESPEQTRHFVDARPRAGGGRFQGHRIAALRHICYRKNGVYLVLNTDVSLKEDRVIGVVVDAFAPVPLARAESVRLQQLILTKHPQREKRFGEAKGFEFSAQLPIVNEARSPVRGHRLVEVRFGTVDATKGPHRALVNLSLGDGDEGVVSFLERD